MNCIGIFPVVNKEMFNFQKRILSFKKLRNCNFNPDELASCGFFFCPVKNSVSCFCCGIKLNDRLCEANLWDEHELGNPKCAYLLIRKVDHSHPEDGIFNSHHKRYCEDYSDHVDIKKSKL
jgi:hypothetical protein